MSLYLKVELWDGQFSSENWVTFVDRNGDSVGLFCDKKDIREQFDGSGLMKVKMFQSFQKEECKIVTLPKHVIASTKGNDSRFVCVKNVQLIKI